MKLTISEDLVLDADFVTSTQAILAQKGKGKSYTSDVEAEELLNAGQVVVIVDPTDAHYGLRSSPDGRSTGYPIAVFGGDHGDVQLEPGGGAVLAEAIVRERFSAIVCTETMTKGEELRFIGDFLETLYRKNREAMHLFLDEADIFAPQAPYGAEARTCGATDDIVRRGRKKGIGCTLITQRASVINKNVLSQADMLVAMGCSHPLDLDAIEKWVRRNADPKLAKEMMTSLPSLPRGEAWAWNPSQHLFKKIAVRRRHTFDSGATPKAGEKKREPKVLAPVDLARLGKAMTDAVERQRENDPKALRTKIAELIRERDQLSLAMNAAPTKAIAKVPVKALAKASKVDDGVELRAEVARWKRAHDELQGALEREIQRNLDPPSVLKHGDLDRLEKIVARAETALEKHDVAVSRHHQAYAIALEGYTTTSKAVTSAAIAAIDDLRDQIRPAIDGSVVDVAIIRADARARKLPPRKTKAKEPPPEAVAMSARASASGVPPGRLKILNAIATLTEMDIDRGVTEVATWAGKHPRTKGFKNDLSALRSAGLVEGLELTAEGRRLATAGDGSVEKPNGLTPGRSKILDTIATLTAMGIERSVSTIAAWAGKHARTKGFQNDLSALRSAGLVDEFDLTPAGKRLATARVPQSAAEAREIVLAPLPPQQRKIVEVVLDRGEIEQDDLAAALGKHPRTKGLNNDISALRGRALLSRGWPVRPEPALSWSAP